jgi:transcriptional regulator with XRE-family HTH domain
MAARRGKYTRHEAALRMGIGARTLARWEAPGFDPETLPIKTLESMAALYGLTVPQLLGRAPLPSEPAA